jgi:hypothetical protein
MKLTNVTIIRVNAIVVVHLKNVTTKHATLLVDDDG